ncbi:hypothetical protein HPP92_025761 [Vanilla planifolia]|uniref:Cleavage and polyadenylation specificity factor subunit 2 n=1 Tax=Vanilla planifolia TaxID=51239 RepID=A0A835U983_VANPL|nr:hypothetical protein HPP92_025761 [Vanilla planifolia]
MGTSVQVTPLCGVYSENPLCYMLSIDGFHFLMDCGWNDLCDQNLLHPLSRVTSIIDAVLLSHPDIMHLGALPYAMKHLGLSAPVYATEPVYRLGLLTMYDHYISRRNVTRLTYSQNYHLSDKGEGIVIAPHVAGHLLGGTVWKITKDGEDVVYAVDFNHRKERHLNGTVLESFVRPAVLITDAYNALNNQLYKRQQALLKVLRGNGNVLLPVDTAGRVLELILILEQFWSQQHLTFPIFFLTNVSTSTIDYVKSFLEWMNDSIAKSFEHTRDNAFLLKHVNLIINKSELEKVPDVPKVVLASMASLEIDSLMTYLLNGQQIHEMLSFYRKGQFGTLARMLQVDPPPKAVKVTISKRVPLGGDELIAYEEEQERLKKEAALEASLNKEELKDANAGDPMVIDAASSLVSSDASASRFFGYGDIFIDGFVPPETSVAPMFPCFENLADWDDYGEVINPDDYIIKEEDMDGTAGQGLGSDLDGKFDEGSAHLLLDTSPSKVVSNELTCHICKE